MLKKRLIGTILIRDGIAVQSIGFSHYLPLGKPEIIAQYLNQWGIDEIILLDIGASKKQQCIDPDIVRKVASECMVPLSVGGGICSTQQIQTLLHAGADKVAINSKAWNTPAFLTEASAVFGQQCIILSCDLEKTADGSYTIRNHSSCGISLDEAMTNIAMISAYGAGEILLQSCDRDGQQNGYDLDMLNTASCKLSSPLIALGGAGHPSHFEKALSIEGISAAAAGNYFNFFEHSVVITKDYLQQHLPTLIRQDMEYNYQHIISGHHSRYPR